jgi:Exonuclease V - a 5' deoxyribonuclease
MDQWYERLPVYAFHETDSYQDKLELLIDPKTLLPGTISLHEVKTTYKESLSQRKNETAIFQTSLYMAFLRRMLDKNTPFDFDPYFRSRGLDPHRAFNPTFASAFSKLQHKFFNPLGSPPRNLQQVVEQWKSYLQSLPTFNIDNRVWVTTIREGRISPVGGFGRAVVSSTASYESREVDALEVAKSVVDLLDGRRQPRGVALGMDNLCIQCPYNHKCPWRPDLHIPHRDVRPLVNPIRDYSVEIPVEKTQLPATLRQPANTGVVGNAILSEGSSGVPSGNPQPKRQVDFCQLSNH